MKWIKTLGLALVFITFATAAGLATYTRSVDPRTWWIVPQVWALNHGLVSVQNFDWGYLKLRSGPAGITALDDLRHHGANDDIRIAAVYVIDNYKSQAENMCTDAPCGSETSLKDFKPVARALNLRTELRHGQVLPRDFIIDTANSFYMLCGSKPKSPDCVLRMQDFDGDGQDEVYLETIAHSDDSAPEDETRRITIFVKRDKGWGRGPYVLIPNFDARTYPQRPFILEPMTMDAMRINGIWFRFVDYPSYSHSSIDPSAALKEDMKRMKSLGGSINRTPMLYAKGAHMPEGLDKALSSGAVSLARLTKNKMLPMDWGTGPHIPPDQYTRAPICSYVENCRAIVTDLDHDGRDEVILIADTGPGDSLRPWDATLLKTDGKHWKVTANVSLCREMVPDITKAKIDIQPSKWGMIRLGQNLYPVATNPWCDNGLRLE